MALSVSAISGNGSWNFLVNFWWEADAPDHRPLLGEVRVEVAEAAGLLGASRGVVLRVEEQDDRLPLRVAEADLGAVRGERLEVGGTVTDLECESDGFWHGPGSYR
jgi:hypothetical protein